MIISFSLRMWLHFSSSVNYQLSTWAEYHGIDPGWPTLKSPSWIASATSELVVVSTVNTGGAHVVTCDHSQVTNTTESQWAWAVAGPAAGERLCPLCSNQASRPGRALKMRALIRPGSYKHFCEATREWVRVDNVDCPWHHRDWRLPWEIAI